MNRKTKTLYKSLFKNSNLIQPHTIANLRLKLYYHHYHHPNFVCLFDYLIVNRDSIIPEESLLLFDTSNTTSGFDVSLKCLLFV